MIHIGRGDRKETRRPWKGRRINEGRPSHVFGNMKVIVVSGARSNVGKTELSRGLCRLLPGAVRVKIGHHPRKPGRDPYLYPMGTRFSVIAREHSTATFLIIESNRILEEITPECAIYLPGENPKPSAEAAMKKADIVRGERLPPSKIALLAKRMECDEALIRAIAELSGMLPAFAPAMEAEHGEPIPFKAQRRSDEAGFIQGRAARP